MTDLSPSDPRWNTHLIEGQWGHFPLFKAPWKHQKEIIQRAAALPNFALFCEPGTGKTLVAITLARFKMHLMKRPLRTLVISPGITLKNWKEEWHQCSVLKDGQVICVLGTGVERAATVRANADKTTVFIASYETLLMPPVMKALAEWKPEILIVDESHKVKSMEAARTKHLIKISALPSMLHRYILTGTPVLNTPMDLFSQYLIMEGPQAPTFGPNVYAFRHDYFYDKNSGSRFLKFPDFRLLPNALTKITNRIAPTSVSLKKEECLDLPPLIRKKIFVALNEEQQKMYREMARDYITYFEGEAVVAQMALTKLLRLMQIVSGFIATEGKDGKNGICHGIKDNPRQKALSELLEEIVPTGKVIVWANFRQNYEQIRQVCRELKFPYVEIHGEINESGKFAAVEKFTADPTIKVLIGSPGSLSCGANLAIAPSSIFYSRSFSLEHSIQAEARTYRAGSEVHERLTRYDVIAEGTVDELIAERLSNKEEISNQVMRDIAKDLRRYGL